MRKITALVRRYDSKKCINRSSRTCLVITNVEWHFVSIPIFRGWETNFARKTCLWNHVLYATSRWSILQFSGSAVIAGIVWSHHLTNIYVLQYTSCFTWSWDSIIWHLIIYISEWKIGVPVFGNRLEIQFEWKIWGTTPLFPLTTSLITYCTWSKGFHYWAGGELVYNARQLNLSGRRQCDTTDSTCIVHRLFA